MIPYTNVAFNLFTFTFANRGIQSEGKTIPEEDTVSTYPVLNSYAMKPAVQY